MKGYKRTQYQIIRERLEKMTGIDKPKEVVIRYKKDKEVFHPSALPDSFSIEKSMEQDLRPSLVDGFVRVQEVFNVIAPPKVGKSFLITNLAFSVANQTKWCGLQCHSYGKEVLIIDNELHLETLVHRAQKIVKAGGFSAKGVKFICCRGEGIGIRDILETVSIPKNKYCLIILDSFYKFLDVSVDENSNRDMGNAYSSLDELAKITGASIGIVHHFSKGSQRGKNISDLGSGAGAMSRAADSHLVLTESEHFGVNSLRWVTRTFSPPSPLLCRFEYPLWVPVSEESLEKKKVDKFQEWLDIALPFNALPATKEQIMLLTGDQLRTTAKRIKEAKLQGCVIIGKKGRAHTYMRIPKEVKKRRRVDVNTSDSKKLQQNKEES